MKKYKKILLALSLIILVLPACRKDQQNPTNLNMQVIDAFGNPIVNAAVTLYQNQYDYNNYNNAYATGFTDGNGNVEFNNINAQTYYYNVYANSNCYSNDFSSYYTSPLNVGQTNSYQVTVSQIGYINLNNNSSNYAFQVYINGTYYTTVSAYSVFKNVPELLGTYTVEVQHIDGTNSETFSATVTDCGTTVVSFP